MKRFKKIAWIPLVALAGLSTLLYTYGVKFRQVLRSR